MLLRQVLPLFVGISLLDDFEFSSVVYVPLPTGGLRRLFYELRTDPELHIPTQAFCWEYDYAAMQQAMRPVREELLQHVLRISGLGYT